MAQRPQDDAQEAVDESGDTRDRDARHQMAPVSGSQQPVGLAGIEDVARMAGVSIATVSRVINQRPFVKPVTRQRVLDAVSQLNYQPNALGRSLAMRRSDTIGLVVTDITNPFYPEVVRGVERAAAMYGVSVLLYDTAERSERETEALRLLSERQVDGMLICSSRLSQDRIAALTDLGRPLALINRLPISGCVGTVETDQEAGVREAFTHLVSLGHRRILYVGGPSASEAQTRREAAYRALCAEFGLSVPDAHVQSETASIAGGRKAGEQLLASGIMRGGREAARPTAVLAYDDVVAVGVMLAMQSAGLSVPGDLSVVGYDDVPIADAVHPRLTTVQQPMAALGEQAVHLLFRYLQARPEERATGALVRLQPRLIIRDSTGPAPSGS